MAEKTKITQEELETINTLQSNINNFLLELGNLATKTTAIEQRQKELISAVNQIEAQKNEFFKTLEIKYGLGNIDLVTREFTPTGK